jgi:Flp pilus assembly pilin Flp
MNTVFGPALHYLRVSLAARYARARSEDTELGASAIEWVIISAIVVIFVVAIGAWLTSALESKAKQVCTGINNSGSGPAAGTKCN